MKRFRNLRFPLMLLGIALMSLASSRSSRADVLVYKFLPGAAFSFSGDAQSGTLNLTFTDITYAGKNAVELVISSSLGTNNGKLENLDPGKAIYLNLTDSQIGNLGFALTANTGFSQAASVDQSADAFKADGTGGHFDALFTYTPSTKAFTNGESQTYRITSSLAGGVSVADFYQQTEDSPHYYGAIHVQNTGSNGNSSGWTRPGTPGGGPPNPPGAVPEPSSLAIAGLGVLGLIGYGLRRRAK